MPRPSACLEAVSDVLEFGLLETKAAGQALAVSGPHLKAGGQTGRLTLHFLKYTQNSKNLPSLKSLKLVGNEKVRENVKHSQYVSDRGD